jgi:hypothetical protein
MKKRRSMDKILEDIKKHRAKRITPEEIKELGKILEKIQNEENNSSEETPKDKSKKIAKEFENLELE